MDKGRLWKKTAPVESGVNQVLSSVGSCGTSSPVSTRRKRGRARGTLQMQRALGYLSGFISDFDIEDPDHDLAGFCVDGDGTGEAVVGVPPLAPSSENGTLATGVSESFDEVFEIDRRKFKTLYERTIEVVEEDDGIDIRWASTSNLLALSLSRGRDSPCAVTAGGHCEDVTEPHMPSSRRSNTDLTAQGDIPRSTWVSWLRRRWSPLKEKNVQILTMEEDRGKGLLERYLTEQTHVLEEAQAELIKLESQHEGVGLDRLLSEDGDGCALVLADLESAEVEQGDEALSQHSQQSQHGGDTSVSGSDEPRHRQSRLSEASTAQFNVCNETPEKKVAASRGTRRSFFGMGRNVARVDLGQVSREDMDGLVDLWKASDEYTDSWTCSRADTHKVSTGGCQQQ